MKTVKLSEHSIWVKLWMFFTLNSEKARTHFASEDKLPTDTCSFKRDLMVYPALNILFFPVILILRLIGLFDYKAFLGKTSFPIVGVLSLLMYAVSYLITDKYKQIPYLGAVFITIFGAIAILVCLFLLIFIVSKCSDKYDDIQRKRKLKAIYDDKPIKPKEPSFIKLLYLSWKDKLCHKIEYEN